MSRRKTSPAPLSHLIGASVVALLVVWFFWTAGDRNKVAQDGAAGLIGWRIFACFMCVWCFIVTLVVLSSSPEEIERNRARAQAARRRTPEAIAERDRRRAARGGLARDHVVLACSTRTDRATWHADVACGRSPVPGAVGTVLLAAVVLLPVFGLAAGAGGIWLGVVVVAVAGLAVVVSVVTRTREARHHPTIALVRILALEGPEARPEPVGSPAKSGLNALIARGSLNAVTLQPIATATLRPDGTLSASSGFLRGSARTCGVDSGVFRELIEGERCVLILDGAGRVIHRLASFAARIESRAARDAGPVTAHRHRHRSATSTTPSRSWSTSPTG